MGMVLNYGLGEQASIWSGGDPALGQGISRQTGIKKKLGLRAV